MIKLSGSRFTDIMPDNLASQVETQAFAYAVGRQIEKLCAYSDAARTYGIGKVSEEAAKLIQVTRECFFEGIKYAKEGNHLFDISGAIGRYAEERGYGVVRDLCGHGIGTALHEAPEIPNYEMNRKGVMLKAGMTLAIEPMINAGGWEVDWLDDDWTVVTRDHSLSAHYENTVLITTGEPRLLTLAESTWLSRA